MISRPDLLWQEVQQLAVLPVHFEAPFASRTAARRAKAPAKLLPAQRLADQFTIAWTAKGTNLAFTDSEDA